MISRLALICATAMAVFVATGGYSVGEGRRTTQDHRHSFTSVSNNHSKVGEVA
jgi:hypothetical protein